MMIHIKHIHANAIIGIFETERNTKQAVLISVKIELAQDKAKDTDTIEDTLNYHDLTNDIVKKVEQSNFFLIEKLANFVLEMVLSHPLAIWAEVEIDKPNALASAESVSVILSKGKV